MPNFGMFPQTQILLNQGTVTTNATSAALTLPPASSYRMIVGCNTVSGTSPTLVVALATSFDGGSTYYSILSTSSLTTTGLGEQILFRPYLGIGDVATNKANTLLGTTDLAAAVINNGPINPQYIKLRFVVSGTSPSFSSVVVGIIAVPQDLAD